jgi:uncharacterized protein YqgV (UPF0045/DUF77 family)
MNSENIKEAGKDFIENTMHFSFNSMETKIQANRMLKCVEFGAELQAKLFETRVYVVDVYDERVDDIDVEGLTNDEFMLEAEQQGRVYTLDGFAKAFNSEEVNTSTDVIRFIEVPVSY